MRRATFSKWQPRCCVLHRKSGRALSSSPSGKRTAALQLTHDDRTPHKDEEFFFLFSANSDNDTHRNDTHLKA